MEAFRMRLNQPDEYDAILKTALPEHGDLTIVTKDEAMQSGRAGALLTFHVTLPDGSIATAQAACSMRLLMGALSALRGRYTDDGLVQPNLRKAGG